MARKLRVQYPGAIYHVMNRGDRRRFLETLGETCAKTGWQVHAWCLMPNHFHLVMEPPRANLVAGMKWFLGTYSSRFNRRHRLFGHLFSGRYKALLVDGRGTGYLRTVCEYVHLNPVRANLLQPGQALREFPWSSYPEYLQAPARRKPWLRVARLMGEMGLARDTPASRREFEARSETRRRQEEPEEWQGIRRGWCWGREQFRAELLEQMSIPMGQGHYGGAERRETDEARAERLLAEELRRRKWRAETLAKRRKGDPEKVKVARRLRRETPMTLHWIAKRLRMGATGYAAQCLREANG